MLVAGGGDPGHIDFLDRHLFALQEFSGLFKPGLSIFAVQPDPFNLFFADNRLHPDEGTGGNSADNGFPARFESTAGVYGNVFFFGKLNGV